MKIACMLGGAALIASFSLYAETKTEQQQNQHKITDVNKNTYASARPSLRGAVKKSNGNGSKTFTPKARKRKYDNRRSQ